MSGIIVEEESIGEEMDVVEQEESFNEPQEETTQEEDVVEIPEKFRNKSVKDVVDMYTNLESEFGRQRNDLGELRKLTDELLEVQLKSKKVETEPTVDVDTLLENPSKVLNDVVASNPRLRQIEEKLVASERQKALSAFEQKHPDWQQLVNSTEFAGWVNGSGVRKRMFQEAHTQYDYDTADELFTLYKQIHKATADKAEEVVQQKRNKSLKAASSESGRTQSATRKVFRRADLINLRINNPDKYEAMEDEIMLAYAEGRVK